MLIFGEHLFQEYLEYCIVLWEEWKRDRSDSICPNFDIVHCGSKSLGDRYICKLYPEWSEISFSLLNNQKLGFTFIYFREKPLVNVIHQCFQGCWYKLLFVIGSVFSEVTAFTINPRISPLIYLWYILKVAYSKRSYTRGLLKISETCHLNKFALLVSFQNIKQNSLNINLSQYLHHLPRCPLQGSRILDKVLVHPFHWNDKTDGKNQHTSNEGLFEGGFLYSKK